MILYKWKCKKGTVISAFPEMTKCEARRHQILLDLGVMLTETCKVRQPGGERPRRWFSDKHLELIVWYEADKSIFGFQLCCKSGHGEKALTWFKEKGFFHDKVDDGEGNKLLIRDTSPIS